MQIEVTVGYHFTHQRDMGAEEDFKQQELFSVAVKSISCYDSEK
jgi:hypothetical protein